MFPLKNNLISLENLQKKMDSIITGTEWDSYILKKIEFSFFATILDAILDFSARHQLCQFMPQFQKQQTLSNILVHNTSCSKVCMWGGGGPGSQVLVLTGKFFLS